MSPKILGNRMHMDDLEKKLRGKFSPENRYANFGSFLSKMTIKGFRGVNTTITFDYPVTAITGVNGAGKSSIAQLAACAYRRPTTAIGARFYVHQFFPVSAADIKPITESAEVVYEYMTNKAGDLQRTTVGRVKSKWSGYKRQPERVSEYIGFTVYIPKIERRDMSIYSSKNVTLTGKRSIIASAIQDVSTILDGAYSDVHFQGIAHGSKAGELGMAERFGAKYSENHMGFGEGRIVYIVDALESAPAQSLFILEEPETSLHEAAQHRFAKYLLRVCERRGHQIIITTHSPAITEALPPEARKLVMRDASGVEVFGNISASRVRTALSSGFSGRTVVCVEDEFAASMLREIIRINDSGCLKAIQIVEAGNKGAVVEAKRVFEKAKIKAIAVRDADVGPDEAQKLFSLPGSRPPEVEVFSNAEVIRKLSDSFGVDFNKITTQNVALDHHEYIEKVAREAEENAAHVQACVIKWFLEAKGLEWHQDWAKKIIAQI